MTGTGAVLRDGVRFWMFGDTQDLLIDLVSQEMRRKIKKYWSITKQMVTATATY